jgi:hypothetical protein
MSLELLTLHPIAGKRDMPCLGGQHLHTEFLPLTAPIISLTKHQNSPPYFT